MKMGLDTNQAGGENGILLYHNDVSTSLLYHKARDC